MRRFWYLLFTSGARAIETIFLEAIKLKIHSPLAAELLPSCFLRR
jgi:hypothetical protein